MQKDDRPDQSELSERAERAERAERGGKPEAAALQATEHRRPQAPLATSSPAGALASAPCSLRGAAKAGGGKDAGPGSDAWRLGMAVTRKTGSAVWRNRVRRLIREFFRLTQDACLPGHDYVVVPKRLLNPRTLTLEQVRAELGPLLRSVANKVLVSEQ
ncbi:ribonuclease P protein component [Desulfovibrio sp. OttesenSCG-928-A18]|nr:ribonuclease P protein component [Desulfovibrio sp. OttesenSCG-928-A18]